MSFRNFRRGYDYLEGVLTPTPQDSILASLRARSLGYCQSLGSESTSCVNTFHRNATLPQNLCKQVDVGE